MTDQPRTYLEPLHDELDRLRATVVFKQGLIEDIAADCERAETALEQAEARVDQLTDQLNLANDTLRRRGNAVNATGHTNDQLRATIARVEKQAAEWERMADELSTRTSNVGANARVAGAFKHAAKHVRAALDDQETK